MSPISRRRLAIPLAALVLLTSFHRPALVHAESTGMSAERALSIVRRINFEGLPRAFQNLRALKMNASAAGEAMQKLAASRPAEMSAHVGQTLLFLMAVTGIELVRVKMMETGVTSEAKLHEMAVAAATHLVNSGSTYLAIFGAALGELGLRYPAQAIGAWLTDPNARPILHQTLVRGILATGGIVGWEAGLTLWSEATLLLETPEEFERSKSLFGMFFGALTGDAADARLAKTMARNLLYVGLLDQKLRSKWMDVTFRTRIMTGEFVTLTAALTAAGVGSMILPGGGTVAAFILGVGAVVIAMNIPEEIRDDITGGLHRPRKAFQEGRLGTVEIELRGVVRSASPWTTPEMKANRVADLLARRRSLRSSYLTIGMESARLALKGMFRMRGTPTTPEAGRAQIRAAFSGIQNFLLRQIEVTDALIQAAQRTPGALEPLVAEHGRLILLTAFFNRVGTEIDPVADLISASGGARADFRALSPKVQEYVKFVEISYARGFDEESVF